jgi:hypothetical protein
MKKTRLAFLRLVLVSIMIVQVTSEALAQTSVVVLSGFKVTDVIDPSMNSIHTLMIEVTVSNPKHIQQFEIMMEDRLDALASAITILPVILNEEQPEVKFEQYSVPFEGNKVTLFVEVRDQFTNPYHIIRCKALDKANRYTEEQVHYTNH